MAVNVQLIKELRDRTGAGMMDCKKALEECNNDVSKACDWLREKGIAKQAKKADRIAAEGSTYIAYSKKDDKASIIEVNCETDFVANSDPFKKLVSTVAEKALTEPKNLAELKDLVKDEFADAALKLGEKLDIRRYEVIKGVKGGSLAKYVHQGGRISVVVILAKKDDELADGLCVHITGGNPRYVTLDDVPKAELDAETKIQLEATKNDPKLAGKPANVLEGIVKGKVKKIFAESTLVEQEYLLDPSKTVGQLLKEKGNEIVKFVRYQVGEGIEKRQDNFAEEVMAEANKNAAPKKKSCGRKGCAKKTTTVKKTTTTKKTTTKKK